MGLLDGVIGRDELSKYLAKEREACARIAETQEFYPDTLSGRRQQWVKERIAAKIRARSEQPGKDGE